MEGRKIKESSKNRELKFNTKEEVTHSINLIREDYSKKARKQYLYILGILAYLIISIFIVEMFMLIYRDTGEFNFHRFPMRLSIFWVLYSAGIYLIFYFLKIIYMKEIPSLMSYLKKEANQLDLKIKRTRSSEKSFLIFITISFTLLLLIDFKIINEYYSLIDLSIEIILILNLTIPMILGLLYDGYKIHLKNNYYIMVNIKYSLEDLNSQTLSIYLTSNILSSKLDPVGIQLHKKISRCRWLPRKNDRFITKSKLTPFLRFFEYSTPVNFKNNILNLALALKDWESRYVNENLVFYQDLTVRRRKFEYCQHRTVNNVCYVLNT